MTEKSKKPEMKNILHSFRVLLRPLLSRSCPITMIYFVDCSIITAYGQIETFDNEHTVYTTVKIGDKEATLGTSEIPGQVTCYILIWEDAGVSCTIMGDGSLDELMKVAESIC